MRSLAWMLCGQEVAARYRRRYRHILVDEFQDTNGAQYELVKLLGLPQVLRMTPRPHQLILVTCLARVSDADAAMPALQQNSVFAVGDPNQAIYTWRGADATKMATSFAADFKGGLLRLLHCMLPVTMQFRGPEPRASHCMIL